MKNCKCSLIRSIYLVIVCIGLLAAQRSLKFKRYGGRDRIEFFAKIIYEFEVTNRFREETL